MPTTRLTRHCLLAWSVALVFILSVATGALAWQPPLSPAQLKERSQLVVVVDILGVARIGTDATAPGRYRAWVQVAAVEKGEAEPTSTLQVSWSAADPNRLGSWEVKLFPGDRARLYLKEAKDPGVWQFFHRSGVEIVRRAPRGKRPFPSRPGEVAFRPSDSADMRAETESHADQPGKDSQSERASKADPKPAEGAAPSSPPATEKTEPKSVKKTDPQPSVPSNPTNSKENGV